MSLWRTPPRKIHTVRVALTAHQQSIVASSPAFVSLQYFLYIRASAALQMPAHVTALLPKHRSAHQPLPGQVGIRSANSRCLAALYACMCGLSIATLTKPLTHTVALAKITAAISGGPGHSQLNNDYTLRPPGSGGCKCGKVTQASAFVHHAVCFLQKP